MFVKLYWPFESVTPITESEFGPVRVTAASGTGLVPSVTVTLIVPTWSVAVHEYVVAGD